MNMRLKLLVLEPIESERLLKRRIQANINRYDNAYMTRKSAPDFLSNFPLKVRVRTAMTEASIV